MTTQAPLRVMLVDDSAIYRKLTWESLSAVGDIELVGSASNGQVAIELLPKLRPDVILLDLEMPVLDGLGVLEHLKTSGSTAAAIMLASDSTASARKTTEALSLGAFDFVLKPTGGSPSESAARLREELTPRLAAFRSTRKSDSPCSQDTVRAEEILDAPELAADEPSSYVTQESGIDIIAIGVSTGGPAALSELMGALPGDLPVPIVLVQHMPAKFTATLADSLDRASPLKIQEAVNGATVRPGHVYIAPGGKQMRLRKMGAAAIVQITDDAPVRNCRPSVDYLFESVATLYGERVLGVILTGMGDDGTDGFRNLSDAGARLMIQDEASSVVHGMPGSVLRAGLKPEVVPLRRIADRFLQHVGGVACR